MKERPALFNGAMVRAILSGAKTQTRRVVKPQPTSPCCIADEIAWHQDRVTCIWPSDKPGEDGHHGDYFAVCPYGKPGDRLWVRETFHLVNEYCGRPVRVPYVVFRDGAQKFKDGRFYPPAPKYTPGAFDGMLWKPSIHMPRWASRITLEITDIRVQRIQEISEADAIAEGIREVAGKPGVFDGGGPAIGRTARHAFLRLWDSIYAAQDLGWEVNPWVWAISFRRLEP